MRDHQAPHGLAIDEDHGIHTAVERFSQGRSQFRRAIALCVTFGDGFLGQNTEPTFLGKARVHEEVLRRANGFESAGPGQQQGNANASVLRPQNVSSLEMGDRQPCEFGFRAWKT